MPRMSGGEALARTLLACGVDHVFGMTVGGQVSFTVSAIRAGMRMMTVRDEKCAALAATAFSRTSGRPGVCISSNPGAAHMALGMHEAHLSDVPMLAISMDVGTASLWLGAAYYDQQAMFQAVTKVTLRAESVAALPDMVRRALHAATTGRTGPAAIIVPAPLWAGEADFPEGAFDGDAEEAVHFPAMRTPPVAEAIGRAADLLVGAERPAILAGGGVKLSEASDELVEVAEHLGIPVAVTHAAHGAFPSAHPLSVGLLGSANAGNRGRIANEIVGEADVVLLVGTRMDTRTTMSDTVPSAGAKLIQVDIHAGEIGSTMPATVGIVADAKLALRGLKDALAERVAPVPVVAEAPEARRISEMMEAWRSEFNPQMTSDSTPIRTPRLFRELQGVIDDNTIVVLDAGGCSYWAPCLPRPQPREPSHLPAGGGCAWFRLSDGDRGAGGCAGQAGDMRLRRRRFRVQHHGVGECGAPRAAGGERGYQQPEPRHGAPGVPGICGGGVPRGGDVQPAGLQQDCAGVQLLRGAGGGPGGLEGGVAGGVGVGAACGGGCGD